MISFGRQILASTLTEACELEKSSKSGDRFADLDALVSELAIRSLRGERIVSMKIDNVRGDAVKINNLSASQSEFINRTFAFTSQQERGSWTLPEKEHISVGWLNLSDNFNRSLRFPLSAAGSEICRVKLESSAEAIFLWSVLAPFIEKLTYPITLRSELAGVYEHDELKSIWKELDDFYAVLKINDIEELKVFRFGGGWSKLLIPAQLEAKRNLLAKLSTALNSDCGTSYRIYAQRALIEQYYKKAKSDGIVKRKQVITKAFQPLLSGFFGGDWLALIEYLGERPHPDEQIVTHLPKVQIYAGGASKAQEIADQEGVSKEEIEKIAAILWQKPDGASPIEERVNCLKKYWQAFGRLHDLQKPGMKPLWGLVKESERIEFAPRQETIFDPNLHLKLLPGDLAEEIEKLWGTTMLNKYPESIVSEPFPHSVMANVFGPALLFWQNCALTAWFLCEGPSSRTDMAGLADHQRHHLAKLENLGTPIDPAMFTELIAAEKRLGPEQSIETEKSSEDLSFGITITISSGNTRRDGFESLRDIISRYRGQWTEKYLEQYLKTQWESQISVAANAFFLKMSDKGGKPPTVKQFTTAAALPTKNWFGGDISLLYTAIGEKVPFQPQKNLLMPEDKTAFVKKVAELLPSRDFNYFGRQAGEYIQKQSVQELAIKSLSFIQIYEATQNFPTLQDFNTKFKQNSPVLHEDENQAWEIYSSAIQKALQAGKSSSRTTVQSAVIKPNIVDIPMKAESEKEKEEEEVPAISASDSRLTDNSKDEIVPTVSEKPNRMVETEPPETPVRRSWFARLLGLK